MRRVVMFYLCRLYNASLPSNSRLNTNEAGVIDASGVFVFVSVLVLAYIRLANLLLFLPSLQAFTVPFFSLT
ncbi:hypothetical protein J3Q64DRAFT_1170672 [Phycomyces blakesleeanus]|uniref:Uncharacterized protein n=1 Tax=Phycomyces blakesleeanus TaxID=4837 RepID=A0ABR3AV55_PHYBL